MTIKRTQKNTFFNVRPELLVCMFLVISTLCVYWRVRDFSFANYDDRQYVTGNYHVQAGLTSESIRWSFTATHAGNWHPLAWLSHMLDCQIYGMNPGPHHMTNVLFHILNTLLLFFIFKRISGSLWKSAFVAALFSLHPLHVESVAWVAERKDVISTFFWMLTLWSYAGYVERSRLDKYLLLILFYILGLMTKPMLVTLPFVLLLLDYWPLKRFQLWSSDNANQTKQRPFYFGLIWEKIPLFLLSAASCILTYFVQKSGGAVTSLSAIPFSARIANILVSYVDYIGKMLWPHNLAVLYPYPKSIVLWKVVGAGMFLAMISVFVFRMLRSKPYLAVGWLWYLGTLVPVIGIVQVGSQALADRYTYVPLIGLFICIVWEGTEFIDRWRYRKAGFIAIPATIVAFLMVTTGLQLRYWQDGVTLFTHNLSVTPNSSLAHKELANALEQQGNIDEAIFHYSKALKINPNDAEAHNNLGYTFALRKHNKEAIDHYREALRIKPSYTEAHNNLGTALIQEGNEKEALYHYYKALKCNPEYAGSYYNLAKIYVNKNQIEKGILLYKKALKLNSEMPQVLYNLSWLLSTSESDKYRNGEEAIKLAERLCKATQYQQPLAFDALAAAYAEKGRYVEAVSTVQKALKQVLKQGPKESVQGLKQRLKLYQNNTPYRQTTAIKGNS